MGFLNILQGFDGADPSLSPQDANAIAMQAQQPAIVRPDAGMMPQAPYNTGNVGAAIREPGAVPASMANILAPQAPMPQGDPSITPGQATQIAQGAPQSGQPQPPANEAEFQQRKSGWMNLLDQVQSNPELQRTILMMGASMLKPHPAYEGVGAGIGQAVQTGIGYYDKAKQQDATNKLNQQKADALTTEANANARSTNATAGIKEASLPYATTMAYANAVKALNEATASGDQARITAAQATQHELENQILQTYGMEKGKAELEKLRASIGLTNAQTFSTNAVGVDSLAKANGQYIKNLLDNGKWQAIQALPEDQRNAELLKLAEGPFGHGKNGNSAQVQMLNTYEQNYRQANGIPPKGKATPQQEAQVSQALVQFATQAKQKTIGDLLGQGLVSGNIAPEDIPKYRTTLESLYDNSVGKTGGSAAPAASGQSGIPANIAATAAQNHGKTGVLTDHATGKRYRLEANGTITPL